MSGKLSQFLESPAGKAVGVAFALLALVAAIYFGIQAFSGGAEASEANTRVWMDTATGKTFTYELQIGDTIPVAAPSGGKTGYPTEKCNWTVDGKPGEKVTHVLLNETVGKPGPTFCPDCKRLVVRFNPWAREGLQAPPTEGEYKPRSR